MTETLNTLLDDLAEYLELPDTAYLSLPPQAYTSKELHELEVKEIFEKSWLCIGRGEYVPNPGDYYTINVMDEPIIVVRGMDGTVRALNAACRHRSMLVVQDRGNAKRFTCPYHAWTYGMDGRLISYGKEQDLRQKGVQSAAVPARQLDGLSVRQPGRWSRSSTAGHHLDGQGGRELPYRRADRDLPL